MRNYEKDIVLNSAMLDLEWLEQSQKADYYSKQLTAARDEFRRAKQKAKVVYAKIFIEVKKHPTAYDFEKAPSDAIADACVLSSAEYKTIMDEVFTVEHNMDLIEQASDNIKELKYALQDLVRLHAAGWFAGPREPHDLSALQKETIRESHAETLKRAARNVVRTRMNTK